MDGEQIVPGMSVLHIVSTLAPDSGGPTEVLIGLAREQSRRGLSVTVATTDRGNPVRRRLQREHFEGLYDRSVRLMVFPVRFSPMLWSPELGAWLRKNIGGFDLVVVHGLYRFPPTFAARQARRQDVPYVIRPHGGLDPYLFDTSTAGSVRLKRLYERWFDLPNLHSAGAIHYTAGEERERAAFLELRAPSFVVPNGVDWSLFESLPARGRLRKRWGLGAEPLVLFLGRLHFKKGLDLLIPAFDIVRSNLPRVQMVVAGPDNDGYERTVRGWVEDRGLTDHVHFVGPLYGRDVVQAYVDADVFALPSYTENFGMTVVEAMACKLPVVISDQVNIHAEVDRAGAGIVARCEAEDVARALTSVLQSPESVPAMGAAGRELVRSTYTWPAIVDSLTEEYENVIRRHRQATRS